MAKHERPGRSDEWYTPAYVFEALGARFALDPATPTGDCPADAWCDVSWTAKGLERAWHGFVWLNPPFGGRNGITPWLAKFMAHGNGVALTPDRTSCPWWQTYAREAEGLLFVAPKIRFLPGPGIKASSPAQGTTLMAKGTKGIEALLNAQANGLGLFLMP